MANMHSIKIPHRHGARPQSPAGAGIGGPAPAAGGSENLDGCDVWQRNSGWAEARGGRETAREQKWRNQSRSTGPNRGNAQGMIAWPHFRGASAPGGPPASPQHCNLR
jgi:hypothetical protein